jgi:hypothetical protein
MTEFGTKVQVVHAFPIEIICLQAKEIRLKLIGNTVIICASSLKISLLTNDHRKDEKQQKREEKFSNRKSKPSKKL